MNKRNKETAQTCKMLTALEVQQLSDRLKANADRLIEDHLAAYKGKSSVPATCPKNTKKNPKDRRGRPAKQVQNPFYGFLGPTTLYDHYPYFAQDIMEGIARLDWHDRPIGQGGSSKPLSVRSLMVILESLEIITSIDVGDLLGIQARHAQRYVKAIELAIPFLMKSRPASLIYEMNLPTDGHANAEYRIKLIETHQIIDCQTVLPTPDELEILRLALGDDAFAPGYLINAAYYKRRPEDLSAVLCSDAITQRTNSSRAGVAQAVA